MQDRGPASYLAEFIGTLMLVLFICLSVSIFVQQPTAQLPAPFIDWSVIGLVHLFILFALIQTLAVVSGAHFNPAVTVAMAALRQIKPPDAVIYIVAQLAGAVAAALIVKLLLNNFPNAALNNFGAPAVGPRLDGKLGLGMLAEYIGTFTLMFVIMGAALDPRVDRAVGPLAIGGALGLAVMVLGRTRRSEPQPRPRLRARPRVGRVGRLQPLRVRLHAGADPRLALGGARLLQPLHSPGREGPGRDGAGRLRPALRGA